MKKKVLGLDKGIFLLGIVSFLTDVSSEMIFSVFSVFATVILGISTVILGIMEGLADFSSSSLDYVSGFLSDRAGKRKKYVIIGYGFSTFAKTILLFANSVASMFAFRVIERLGKSFRGPPRDAWIASLAEKSKRGYAFGLHKAFDKAGAIVGPLIGYFILNALGQNLSSFRILFFAALIPAVASIFVLFIIGDKESKPVKRENIFKAYGKMNNEFKHYIYSASLFSLAYFSISFLMLKAYIIGFEIKNIILLYALFNASFVVFSIPFGRLSDKIGRMKIITLGYLFYFLMCIGFVLSTAKWQVAALFILFGMFYAIDEGQSKAYLSDLEKKRRASAIGVYNFITGLIYLPASIIAGLLWKINPSYAFIFAAAVSLCAIVFFSLRKADS